MRHSISGPIIKTDHKIKVEGKAEYIADIRMVDMLYGKTLRSTEARAYIKSVKIPELPDGYTIVDHKDIPGKNRLKVMVDDQPIFAEDQVNYVGEAILLVIGPIKEKVVKILDAIEVEYEPIEPIFTLDQSEDQDRKPIYGKDNCFAQYEYKKGNSTDVFANAVKVIEEQFETGYQEHVYIETQGMIGAYEEEKVTVYGSMQCPYYVKNALIQALGCKEDQARVVQTTTGGGFGGKEDYPSLLACHVAIATRKMKKPVQILLDRKEDMEITTKRHPALLKYKTALDKDHNIIGMNIEIKLNGGAYAGLSSVVLQRALINATGVYDIPNVSVQGKALATNTVPTGAFRGFGAPQSFFAIEMHMEHIAKEIEIQPLEYKERYMVKKGDPTSTGGCFHEEVMLPKMIEEIVQRSKYREKVKQNKKNIEMMKKGIGMSLFLHGCGFTGSGERDHIKATVKLKKYEDGIIEILAANVDMGQGLQTTLNKIVANTLEIPVQQVIYKNPDTDRVPDSGPTVASRTLMIVGKLLERAARRLKEEWIQGQEQEVIEHYQHPALIPWDEQKFKGDAYPAYSWGINVVEVEVDSITGQIGVCGVWSAYDIGNPIDERIVRGQIEGGILQGLGYGSLEVMESEMGRIKQKNITDYIIPTAKDIVKMDHQLFYNPYKHGPFGAKGVGELTLIGSAPAFVAAVENAVGNRIYKIPVRPEEVLEVLAHGTES